MTIQKYVKSNSHPLNSGGDNLIFLNSQQNTPLFSNNPINYSVFTIKHLQTVHPYRIVRHIKRQQQPI